MPHPKKPTRTRVARNLHLGEWLTRLGRKPVEAARAGSVTPQYISELISGKKKNPSPVVLLDISEWLGLSINDLYSPPPSPGATEAVEGLNPSQLAVLGSLLDQMKPGRRR